MTPLVFVDTESDGLHPGRRAWEIGMVRRDDQGERELRIFLPLDLKFADPAALKIGGFWDRHPAGRKLSGKDEIPDDRALCDRVPAPCEPVTATHEAAKRVMAWTFDAHLVGANPAFDAHILERLLRAEGYLPSWHYRLVDVEAMTAGFCHRIIGGLDACLAAAGISIPEQQRHTALGDARAVMRLYDEMLGGAA